jgi:nucleotide-binding universal stress UspA family protein
VVLSEGFMRLLASIFILSVAAAPALAQPAVAPPAPGTVTPAPTETTNVSPATITAAERKAKAKADGVVCHQETRTGSHLPTRVCTTAQERQAARASADRTQESVQGRFTPATLPN